MFLGNILYEFLPVGSAALVESGIDGVFVWVDEL